jgi:hypothetical protein
MSNNEADRLAEQITTLADELTQNFGGGGWGFNRAQRIAEDLRALAALAKQQAPEATEQRQALAEAIRRMDLARDILTDGNPRPDCNWGLLATEDLRAALTTHEANVPGAVKIGVHQHRHGGYDTADEAIAALSSTPEATAEPAAVPVGDLAKLLLDTWKRVDPKSNVALYPESYVANFADMARAVLAAQGTQKATNAAAPAMAVNAICWRDPAPNASVPMAPSGPSITIQVGHHATPPKAEATQAAAGGEPDLRPILIRLLTALRPKFGAVGTRDVDVAAEQGAVDKAIAALTPPSPAQSPKQPAQAEPMSDAKIDEIFDAHNEAPTMSYRYLVARAILAEAGIKEKP